MLRPPLRELIIQNKSVLEKAIIWYANGLPDMDREPTDGNNTLALFGARDDFLPHIDNASKKNVLEAIIKIVISEAKHDPVWQQWGDKFIELYIRHGWKPLPQDQPSGFWREDV